MRIRIQINKITKLIPTKTYKNILVQLCFSLYFIPLVPDSRTQMDDDPTGSTSLLYFVSHSTTYDTFNVQKLKYHIHIISILIMILNIIIKMINLVFECTLEMINKDFEVHPEHRTNFFTLLQVYEHKYLYCCTVHIMSMAHLFPLFQK